MDTRLERAPVGVLEVSMSGTVREMNRTAGELLAVDPDAAAGQDIAAVFPESVSARVPRAFETVPESDRSFEEYYPGPDQWFAVDIVPAEDAVYVYLQDETDDRRRSQQLDALRSDLRRLTIGNELIADILADLVGASTREEIAETICRRLGGTDIYEFAWVGERDIGSDDMVMRAAAGTTGRTLERIEEGLGDDGALPELRAVESGRPEIVQPLGEDTSVPEQIRRAAFADGLQSLLAVPLSYGSSVYGVVGVYTADQDAFSERERDAFGTVGKMAGLAINATRHRSLLLSDTVVEVTFDLSDPEAPFVAAATELSVDISITGLVPQGDRLLCYVEGEGAAPGAIATLLSEHGAVLETRVIASRDEGGSLEVFLDEDTPLGHLVSQGGTIQSAEFGGGDHRVVVNLPPEEDIRRIAEAVTRQYDADVLAKRDRERDERTAGELKETLTTRLTDRQEDALRTALFADYFQSPRGSSAEEVAEALGITGPTFLHHLRAGQRKLLEELFETTDHEPRSIER